MRPLLVLVLLASAAVAGPAWKAFLAPGPLAEAHDPWVGDCESCHLAFEGVPGARCLTCHEALADRMASGEGFHAVQKQDCTDCHTDHQGLEASLTLQSALKAFDHAATGFDLHGAHDRVDCATCHEDDLGSMDATCGSCHDDPHGSALGPTCDSCHQPVRWQHQLKTLAAHLVATDGGHVGLGCEDCHTHGEHLELSVMCNDCHEEAHGGTTALCDQCHEVAGWGEARFDHGPCTCAFPGKHQTVGCLSCHEDFVFTDTPILCSGCHTDDRPHDDLGECASCHDAVSWSENRFDHDRKSRFPIEGAHEAVSCVQCHTEAGTFRGAPTSCEGCHAEQGTEAHGDFGACADCHEVAAFAPSTFDHATTGFPLSGRHEGVPCQHCHAEKVDGFPRAPEATP